MASSRKYKRRKRGTKCNDPENCNEIESDVSMEIDSTAQTAFSSMLAATNTEELNSDRTLDDLKPVCVKIETNAFYDTAEDFYSAFAKSAQTLPEEKHQDLSKQNGFNAAHAKSEHNACVIILKDVKRENGFDSTCVKIEQTESEVMDQDVTRQICSYPACVESEQSACTVMAQEPTKQTDFEENVHANMDQSCSSPADLNSLCVKREQTDHSKMREYYTGWNDQKSVCKTSEQTQDSNMDSECTSQRWLSLACGKIEHPKFLHIDHNYAASVKVIAARVRRVEIKNTIINRVFWETKNHVNSNTDQVITMSNDPNLVFGKRKHTENSKTNHCLKTPDHIIDVSGKSKQSINLNTDQEYSTTHEPISLCGTVSQIEYSKELEADAKLYDVNSVCEKTVQNDYDLCLKKRKHTENSKTNHCLKTPDHIIVVSGKNKQSINSNTDQEYSTTHEPISLCGTVSKIEYSKELETDAKLYDVNSVCEKTVQTDYDLCLEAPRDSSSKNDGNEKGIPKLTAHGTMMIDRSLACYFCGELYENILVHLENYHMDEYMVAAERDIDMTQIINLGALKYNLGVILTGKGCAIVARYQKRFAMQSFKFALPCIHCYGFYDRKHLWKHTNTCPWKGDNRRLRQAEVISRSMFLISGGLASTLPNELSVPIELQDTVFQMMKQDAVYSAIVTDSLVLLYGQVLIHHLGSIRTKYVAKRMRHLGKLKIQLNELKEQDVELNAYISPWYFDAIITAVKSLGGYRHTEEFRPLFEAPSLALSLGHSLVRLAELKRGIAIQRKSFVSKSESDNFFQLHCNHWNRQISSIALGCLKENTFNKSMVLPVVRDLLKMKCYLHTRLVGLAKLLSETPDVQVWKLLADVTLASIILFNRRRRTGVSQLLRLSYRQRMYGNQAIDAEVTRCLRPIEKLMLKRLQLVLTLGRLNTPYPVLLTQNMVTAIETLEGARTNCGIPATNMFVFACPDKSDSHINAWHVLNPLAHEAGCQQPDLISSSHLRTYLATVYQVLEIEDRELELLSGHLHIDINTRMEHYRQPGATEDIAKLACLILMAESREIQTFDGKKLSQIHVSELDVPIDDPEYTDVFTDVDILDDELAGKCSPNAL